jgi:hypothetical protein
MERKHPLTGLPENILKIKEEAVGIPRGQRGNEEKGDSGGPNGNGARCGTDPARAKRSLTGLPQIILKTKEEQSRLPARIEKAKPARQGSGGGTMGMRANLKDGKRPKARKAGPTAGSPWAKGQRPLRGLSSACCR